MGHAGRRVAALGHAFGMTVLANDPFVEPGEIRSLGAEPAPLADLLGCSDVVSLHCPLDGGTAGVTREAREARVAMATMAAARIVALARGERPPRLVNPQAWPACCRRLEQRLGRSAAAR
ncbi:MAG: hypothetical protein KGL43_27320 [Burkholderiales bacterium]|nr:hypothetical protein [Burkholderiales bacterium]MDE2396132.1 hypothetical protein [Burkholderiales bacterium]MDE2457320.1 hypothetical protein [Burkholderiales bacterium]